MIFKYYKTQHESRKSRFLFPKIVSTFCVLIVCFFRFTLINFLYCRNISYGKLMQSSQFNMSRFHYHGSFFFAQIVAILQIIRQIFRKLYFFQHKFFHPLSGVIVESSSDSEMISNYQFVNATPNNHGQTVYKKCFNYQQNNLTKLY